MKINGLVVVLVMLAGTGVAAQEPEQGASASYTHATYFDCDRGGLDRADEIFRSKSAPVLDQMVKAGKITGWGWMAQDIGGKWRRMRYYDAPSVVALLDAQDEIANRLEEGSEFSGICGGHDDYIWQRESGSTGLDRGDAGWAVYYVCTESREDRIDEIFAKDFGPILDKLVTDGKLKSWGWRSHHIGGKYRRMQIRTAASHKDLLKARDELLAEIARMPSQPGKELTEICGSHADYMWSSRGKLRSMSARQ